MLGSECACCCVWVCCLFAFRCAAWVRRFCGFVFVVWLALLACWLAVGLLVCFAVGVASRPRVRPLGGGRLVSGQVRPGPAQTPTDCVPSCVCICSLGFDPWLLVYACEGTQGVLRGAWRVRCVRWLCVCVS